MAARFGATIVPFGTVGEDDVAEVRPFFCHIFYIFCHGSLFCWSVLFFCCVISSISVYLKANLGKIEEKKTHIFEAEIC
jgi:tryptophan-rich sensory protein